MIFKPLPRTKKGQAKYPSDHFNRALGEIERSANLTTGGMIAKRDTPHGRAITLETDLFCQLFQLTKQLNYPDPTRTAGSSDEPDVPWSDNALPVLYEPANYVYARSSQWAPVTLYHPTAFRNSSGIAIGHPSYRIGDRCYAKFSSQTGRWEIVTPPMDIWRFELKEELVIDGSAEAYLRIYDGRNSASCSTLQADEDIIFRVWDEIHSFYGPAGNVGMAKYIADCGRWAIVCMECP